MWCRVDFVGYPDVVRAAPRPTATPGSVRRRYARAFGMVDPAVANGGAVMPPAARTTEEAAHAAFGDVSGAVAGGRLVIHRALGEFCVLTTRLWVLSTSYMRIQRNGFTYGRSFFPLLQGLRM